MMLAAGVLLPTAVGGSTWWRRECQPACEMLWLWYGRGRHSRRKEALDVASEDHVRPVALGDGGVRGGVRPLAGRSRGQQAGGGARGGADLQAARQEVL